jgi:quercetin dioxygenase-like cupin family protein
MAAQSTRYFDQCSLDWQVVDVRGTPMQEARVMTGEQGIYSAFYRLPKDTEIRRHLHVNWVQVMVLEGRMEVSEKESVTVVGAGGCYVVPGGGRHVERALDDAMVLVTSPDP